MPDLKVCCQNYCYINKYHLMLHVCAFAVLWTQNNIHTLVN